MAYLFRIATVSAWGTKQECETYQWTMDTRDTGTCVISKCRPQYKEGVEGSFAGKVNWPYGTFRPSPGPFLWVS